MTPQHIIDDLVITNIINTLNNINQIKEYWMMHNSGTDIAEMIQHIEKDLADISKKKSRLINAITEGIIDFADAKQKMTELDATVRACNEKLDELKTIDIRPPDWDDISITAADIAGMDITEKRELIIGIVRNISVSNTKLMLTYKFPRHADGRKTAKINLPPPGTGGPKQLWKIK